MKNNDDRDLKKLRHLLDKAETALDERRVCDASIALRRLSRLAEVEANLVDIEVRRAMRASPFCSVIGKA